MHLPSSKFDYDHDHRLFSADTDECSINGTEHIPDEDFVINLSELSYEQWEQMGEVLNQIDVSLAPFRRVYASDVRLIVLPFKTPRLIIEDSQSLLPLEVFNPFYSNLLNERTNPVILNSFDALKKRYKAVDTTKLTGAAVGKMENRTRRAADETINKKS